MSRNFTLTFVLAGLLLSLGAANSGRAEDAIPLNLSIKNPGLLASTRANSFLSAMPGGRFVITVAHVAPSPEDAIVRGVPATCESVRFRLDTLVLTSAEGEIEIELGEEQTLEPGQATRIMREIDPRSGTGVPPHELDMLGFRVRAEQASGRCGVVASGLFFPQDPSSAPMSVGLIPDLGPSPKLSSGGGR
jgi:hypothetical protein